MQKEKKKKSAIALIIFSCTGTLHNRKKKTYQPYIHIYTLFRMQLNELSAFIFIIYNFSA